MPFYSVEQVTADQFSDTKSISEESFEQENKRVQLEEGDILMTRIGSVGVAKLINWDVRASFYVSLALIKKSPNFSSQYLVQHIKSQNFQCELWKRTIHVAFPKKINLGEIGKCIVRLPSKEEQQKIASFLSSVDTKIERLGKKKALLKQYKKGMMQKVFIQEIRFKDEQGNDYPDWKRMPFTKVLKALPSKKFQIKSSEILSGGPYKVVDQGKKLVAGFSDQNGKVFETDGVVVYGDHTTIVKFVNFSFIVGADGTKVLKPTKEGANIKYLYYCLVFYNVKSEGYKRHFSILKQLWLPVPCTGEQQKIANFLSAIDKKIELVATQLEQARTFKKGLLQQMFI